MKKLILTCAWFGLCLNLTAQNISLTPDNWSCIKDANKQAIDLVTEDFKGKKAMHLNKNETALLKNKQYDNFVLEMDIAGGVMPCIGFRAQDLWDHELIYFRIGGSGKNTAIQYLPVFQGAVGWQLYNYPIYETKAVFGETDWFHVKMEVYGDNMRVFINDAAQPNMEVKLVYKQMTKGQLFIRAWFNDSYFANINVKPLNQAFEVSSPKNENTYLHNWEISEQVDVIGSQREYFTLLDKAVKEDTWQEISADENGIINITKYFDHPQKAVFAKTNIKADRDLEATLLYDYSHTLMIVLNGNFIFYGKEMDTHNFMRMIDGEESIPLSLKKGDNELVFMIGSDDTWQKGVGNEPYMGRRQAMNWGFIARLSDYQGIKVRK